MITNYDDYRDQFTNDVQHLLDGSVRVSQFNGGVYYLFNNKFHRISGPAVITASNRQEWYYMGKNHRLDGPAITYSSGKKEWWVDGVEVTEEFPLWAKSNEITYPFSIEQETLFKLLWILG